MDYITDRRSYIKQCPQCEGQFLEVKEWVEHIEGWGFENYRTEEWQEIRCRKCGYRG